MGRCLIDLFLSGIGYQVKQRPVKLSIPPPQVPLLILSDLGHYGSRPLKMAWRRETERLSLAGAHLIALLPVPDAEWQAKQLTHVTPMSLS